MLFFVIRTAALGVAAAVIANWYRMRLARSRRCLAVALGGSSDIVGSLALATALGYHEVILVQPGSPARGAPVPTAPTAVATVPSTQAEAPGGGFFDNDSMIAYLLSACTSATAGYYLQQVCREA